MASMQEDVTSQAFELFLKFFGTGTEFVFQMTHEGNVLVKRGMDFAKEVLLAKIREQKKNNEPTDAIAQMLYRQQKGETIRSMLFADEEAAELAKRFMDNKILFTMIDSPKDDTKIFMYMSGDAEKVADIVALWQAEKGLVSEINPDLFLNYYAKEGVGTLSGLDKADLEMFRQFAKDNKLIFASVPAEEEGRYIIIYNPKDKEIVRKTMDSTLWAFSGKMGDDIKDRVFALIKNRERIMAAVATPEKEFYIVNAKDRENYVRVTSNEVIYYKKSKEVARVDRSSKDFMERALQYINGLEEPLLFQKEEFETRELNGTPDAQGIDEKIRRKTKGLPDRDKLRKDQEEHNERLERVQSKMALDDENTAGFWIYDDDIDFEAGGSYEVREDIDEQMKTDIMDARKRAAKFRFHEVNAVDNRSLDYFIAEAEKHKATPVQEHQQLDRTK